MTLVVLVGPPAVGKMTVGMELQRLTGLRLFHNHVAIDLALQFFPYGHPSYRRIVGEVRQLVFDEVAASDLPGLIFTYVWAFDRASDRAFVDGVRALFERHGRACCFAELETTQAERLRRSESELRLAHKPFKRDLAASRAFLLEADATYQLSSRGAHPYPDRWLHLDVTTLPPADAARRIAERFALPVVVPGR